MKSVLTAIAEFQYECPTILKDTQGYGYKYTDISTIIEQIKPLLKKHKLGFYQGVDGQSLKTVVFHTESGESITESALIPHGVSLKGMNDFQVLGSAITYMRRYQLSAMLGIVTDKDIDGAGEQVTNDIPYTQKKPTIPMDRFAKAYEAIQTGEYSLEKFKYEYNLTTEQLNLLKKLV